MDCWALGVLAFEYTAGYTPFQSPGEPTDITALFTRIAGSKVANSKSIFPNNYDQKVRRDNANGQRVVLGVISEKNHIKYMVAGISS